MIKNSRLIATILIAGGIMGANTLHVSADMLNLSPGQKVQVNSTVKAYTNSELAKSNADTGYKIYDPSEYFVYKVVDGAVNITRNPGLPGGWVENSQIVISDSSSDNSSSEVENNVVNDVNKVNEVDSVNEVKKETENTSTSSENMVTITSAVRVYSNAASAVAQNGYYISYSPATYYVYKSYGNAINISKTPGVPGGWVSKDVIEKTSPTVEKVETKPVNTVVNDKTEETTTKTETPVTKTESLVLKTSVKAYVNADLAISNASTYVNYGPSTYYIYKKVDGATNISKTPGIPGAWVSNKNLEASKSGVTLTSPAPTPVTNTSTSGLSSKEKMMKEAGISESNWEYVDFIVTKESNWNPKISNPYSGAYGLPQALPGSKMATAGSDWATNPVTQLRWMDSYVKSRYGSWLNAYNFWLKNRWY